MVNRKSHDRTLLPAARSAADWEEAALDALAAGGIHALTIPALAATLGVTKGSFYWHFRSFDELIDGALRLWEEHDGAALAEIERIADPFARLESLFREALQTPRAHGLLIALSGSAVPRVSAAIRRVSERRLAVLVDAYRQMGFAPAESLERALLVYSAYVGLLHLRNESSPWLRTKKSIDAYVKHAVATLIPRRASRTKR